ARPARTHRPLHQRNWRSLRLSRSMQLRTAVQAAARPAGIAVARGPASATPRVIKPTARIARCMSSSRELGWFHAPVTNGNHRKVRRKETTGMNYQHQRHGLRATSLSVGVALALAAGVAVAQETTAPDQGATTLDRIEVTGTRIRQVDVETAQPVFIMSREDIERQGFQSVADILQSLPVVGTPPISRASPLSSGENIGGQYVQMRNLTANRTLVLVNGRRLGSNTSGLQDISILPTTAIERVEVLKDGASSIYGSDAIAGVINFITRSGFEGATATAYYGQYTQGDGDVTRGSFLMGFNGDRGSLTTAVEYRKEAEVWSADRPFSAYPQGSRHPTRGWTTVSQWGAIVLPAALGGTRVLDQGADWRDIANYHPINSDTG